MWLLIVVLIIWLVCVVRGWRRGGLRVLYSLVSIVLLIWLCSALASPISGFLAQNTGLQTTIEGKCADWLKKQTETKIEEAAGVSGDSADDTDADGNNESLSNTLKGILGKNAGDAADGDANTDDTALADASASDGDETSAGLAGKLLPKSVTEKLVGRGESAVAESGIYSSVGEKIAGWIIGGLSFFAAFIAALVIVRVIGKALGWVNRIPVLGKINKFFGLLLGVLKGYVVICLILALISVFSFTALCRACIGAIEQNALLLSLYESNPLLSIITSVFS